LRDDGGLLPGGSAYATTPSIPSAPMSLMARWAMASLALPKLAQQ
jgi:hypothetical protein